MTSKPPTVGEIIAQLQEADPDAPVIVSTHYDNDIGYASQISVGQQWMEPTEGSFWDQYDPEDLRAMGDPLPEDGVHAVVITASG